MEGFKALREAVAAYLAADKSQSLCRVTGEYPARWRALPLREPVVAVGFEAIRMTGSLGGLVAGAEGDGYGLPCTVVMRFSVFVPALEKEVQAHEVLEWLWNRLLLGGNPFGFVELEAGPIAWDSACEANCLVAKGTLRMAMAGAAPEAETVTEVDIVRVEA